MYQKKMKLKKFNIKYNFLYLSLHNFLHWRETNNLKSKSSLSTSLREKKNFNGPKYKFLKNSNIKIENNSKMQRKSHYHILNSNFKSKTLTKKQTEIFTNEIWLFLKHSILSNSVNNSLLLSDNSRKFLPHRKSFLSYWGFPLLSFVSLTFYNLNLHGRSNLELWPNLQIKMNFSFSEQNKKIKRLPLLLEKKNHFSNENVVFYKDRDLGESFSQTLSTEKKEFKNLTSLYLLEIQDYVFNHEISKNKSNELITYKKYQNSWLNDFLSQNLLERSIFYWKWYLSKNSIYSNLVENTEKNRILLKNKKSFFPDKINPLSKINLISMYNTKNSSFLPNNNLKISSHIITKFSNQEKENPIISYLRGSQNFDEINKLLISYSQNSTKIFSLLNILKDIEIKIEKTNKEKNIRVFSEKLSNRFDKPLNNLIANLLIKQEKNFNYKNFNEKRSFKYQFKALNSRTINFSSSKLKNNFLVQDLEKENLQNNNLLSIKKDLLVRLKKLLLNKYLLKETRNLYFNENEIPKLNNFQRKLLTNIQKKKKFNVLHKEITYNELFDIKKTKNYRLLVKIKLLNYLKNKWQDSNVTISKFKKNKKSVSNNNKNFSKKQNQDEFLLIEEEISSSILTMFKELKILKSFNKVLNSNETIFLKNFIELKSLNSKEFLNQTTLQKEQKEKPFQIVLTNLLINKNLQNEKLKKEWLVKSKIESKEMKIVKLQQPLFMKRTNSGYLKWKNLILRKSLYSNNVILNLNLYSKKKLDTSLSQFFLNTKQYNFLYNNSIKRYATSKQLNKANHSNSYFRTSTNRILNEFEKNILFFEQLQESAGNKLNDFRFFSKFVDSLSIKLSHSLFFPYFKLSSESTDQINSQKIHAKQFRFLETLNNKYYVLNSSIKNLKISNSDKKFILNFKKISAESSPQSNFLDLRKNSVPIYKLKKLKEFKQKLSLKYDKSRKSEKLFRSYLSLKNNEINHPSSKNENLITNINDFSTNTFPSSSLSYKKKASMLKLLKKRISKNQRNILSNGLLQKSFEVEKNITQQKTLKSNFNCLSNLKYSFLKEKSNQVSKELKNKKVSEKIRIRKLNHTKNLKYQNSPNTTLQKLGFIFFTKAEKIKTSLNDESFIKRIEKQKYQQKKRRRKKQKLENRRRKKRKRFFPRPVWLRFQMYNKFQKIRHLLNLSKKTNDVKKSKNRFNLNKNLNLKEKKNNIKLKIYRTNKQQWGFNTEFNKYFEKQRNMLKNSFNYTNSSNPVFISHDLYQVSNKVMNDFQQQCWKSYWLRSNLTTYIRRVQQSLNNIRQKEIQNYSSLTLKNHLLRLIGVPNTLNTLDNPNSYFSDNPEKVLNQKSNKLLGYLNIKNSLQSQQFVSNSSLFQNLQDTIQYNRLLYDRISDIIKNVKIHLNIQGQSNTKSFKRNRRKAEKQLIKNNFWTNLEQNLDSEVNRVIAAVFSDLNVTIKPYGDLPSLRILWALNKTQIFAFKPNTELKNLWLTVKNREQNKNNKTKKFFTTSWKKIFSRNLENLSYSNQNQQLLINQNATKNQKFKLQYFIKNFNDFNDISFKKIQKINKKVCFLGLSKQNLNIELRAYKKRLKNLNEFNKQQNQSLFISKKQLIPIVESQSQKYPYRSEQFWWSIKNQNGDLLSMIMNSNYQIEDFSTIQSSYFLNILWAGTILFHISFLFTFLRFPEIRSFMKFNLLLFFKISNSYLIFIYFIYNNLKTFKGGLNLIFNSLLQFTLIDTNSLNFSEKNSFNQIKNKNSNENHKIKKLITKKRKNIIQLQSSSSVSKENISELTNSEFVNKNLTLQQIKKYQYLVNLKNRLQQNQRIRTITSFKELNFDTLDKFEKEKTSLFFVETLFYSPNIKTILNFDKNWQSVFNENLLVYKKDFDKNKMNKLKIELIRIQTFNRQLIYLGLLSVKFAIIFILNSNRFVKNIFYKSIEIFENILLIIYKFLEKPAELMIEWIGQIFLIEWSSDIMSFVPETLDIYTWKTITKVSRSQRFFGIFGFIYLRRLWSIFEIAFESITKSDSDLITRQKKGILFWDIWGELLIQAAEKYNINIPSLTTLKEEQEMLIEKLLDDNDWSKFVSNSSVIQISPLLSMLETSPRNFSIYSSNQETINNNFSALEISLINEINNRTANNLTTNTKLLLKNNKQNGLSLFNSDKSLKLNLEHLFLSNITDYNPFQKENNIKRSQNDNIWKRWSINQYFTYQGTDTDLFIDINPPKSFSHMSTLKYYEPAQQALGPIVCQIYSGLFQKQVSRNILVVGAPGTAKSLLIQALAGETEFKIIVDNANRYALVQRGIAVGMKLLRDVFDAIALHTPCLFLLEDIHVIGERRSMLISDDENAKASQSHNFSEQDEVHEKNQILYQFSKHSISYYKKPYKGDFEFLIPTNQFCFDLFLGIQPPRNSQITPRSPLSLKTIESHLSNSGQVQATDSFQNMFGSSSVDNLNRKSNYMSQLELPKENYFAPSATSPFTILVMKEQKKLRPKKLVKEMPWGSFSWTGAKMLLIPKTTYSIRVKIALLADITIRNMSVKLDMITDLLVIMDSVRSNFGFIVFATTHVPYILDPALRRPGRLDETISLSIIPNLLNRWEILRMNLINFSSTFDCLDYALLTSNLVSASQRQGGSETQITNFISKAKLLLFNKTPIFLPEFKNNEKNYYGNLKMSYPIYSMHQAMKLLLNFEAVDPYQISNRVKRALKRQIFKNSLKNNSQSFVSSHQDTLSNEMQQTLNPILLNSMKSFDIYPSFPPIYSSFISNSYSQISQFLIESQLLLDHTSYKPIFWSKMNVNTLNLLGKTNSSYSDLYTSKFQIQNELIHLLSGQIGQFFLQNNSSLVRYSINHFKFMSPSKVQFSNKMKPSDQLENYLFRSKQKLFEKQKQNQSFENLNEKQKESLNYLQNKQYQLIQKNSFVYNLQNNNYNGLWSFASTKTSNTGSLWHSATSFITQLVQKRYLYNKNLLMTKMLFFEDQTSLRQAPSPPSSSILMPAKKFENLKRMEKDYQEKPAFLIYEKIQIHQQQKLMKELYNKPVITYFKSQNMKNRYTPFLTAFKELGYKNSKMNISFPSSTDVYQKNKILTRHKFSLINQWWNSQFAEHNSETTFLSDVDWRSMFVDSSVFTTKKETKEKNLEKNQNSTFKNYLFNVETLPYKNAIELTIDFPDTIQYYNPRHRRWYLNSTFSNYWLTFEKSLSYEIYNHYLAQSFNQSFNYLDKNREILDSFSYNYLTKGQLLEIDLLSTLARFFLFSKVKKI